MSFRHKGTSFLLRCMSSEKTHVVPLRRSVLNRVLTRRVSQKERRTFGVLGFVAALAASSLVGCSYFLKDRTRQADPIQVGTDGSGTSCLSKSLNDLKSVVVRRDANGGRTSRSESSRQLEENTRKVTDAVDCVIRSLDLFAKNVRGETPGRYSEKEIGGFIERYFLNGERLKPDLLPVVFRFKSAWFGGTESFVTKQEVARIRAQVVSLKTFAHRILPHLSTLVLSNQELSSSAKSGTPALSQQGEQLTPSSLKQFEVGVSEFVEAISEQTGAWGSEAQTRIQIADIEKLLGLFSESLPRYAGLIGALKQLLVRPPHTAIASSDWPDFFRASARLYTAGLRYQRYVRVTPFLQLEDSRLSQLEMILVDALGLVEEGLSNRLSSTPQQAKQDTKLTASEAFSLDQTIAPTEISIFLDELAKVGFFGEKIRSESVQKLVWPFMARLLRDPTRLPLPRGAPTGLGPREIQLLRSDLANWAAGHRMAISLFEFDRRRTIREMLRVLHEPRFELIGKNASPLVLAAYPAPQFATVARLLRTEMDSLLSQGRALTWNRQNHLRVQPYDDQQEVARGDLIFFNIVRTISRIVARGYSSENQRSQQGFGITETEMQELYLDARSLGTDLTIMDSRITNAGLRSFFEANLFMSVSNGDFLVSPREGLEFLSSIVSGGRVAGQIFNAAKATCALDEFDYLGRHRLDPGCLREHLRAQFFEIFEHLPGMREFVKSFGGFSDHRLQWLTFIETIENASRAAGFSDESIEFNDLKVMTTILQYIESLFVTFDADRSGLLETTEVWKAFPNFKGFIKKLGQGWADSEIVQRSLYSYLVTFGQAPQLDFMGQMHLVGWSVRRHFQSEKADRLAIAKILASIKQVARQRGISEIVKWFGTRRSQLSQLLSAGDLVTATELAQLFYCPNDQIENLAALVRAEGSSLLLTPTIEERRRQACRGIKIYDRACEAAETELTAEIFTERLARKLVRAPKLSETCQPTF